MQGKRVNRRAVEALIRCGAMDGLGANRKQMLQGLYAVMDSVEESYKQTMYGQVGFFDLGEEYDFGVTLPDVEEFSKAELLAMEKEMTGLYLSGHPMEKYEDHHGKCCFL
jgi:DNA polymerase-3 subunit alpha